MVLCGVYSRAGQGSSDPFLDELLIGGRRPLVEKVQGLPETRLLGLARRIQLTNDLVAKAFQIPQDQNVGFVLTQRRSHSNRCRHSLGDTGASSGEDPYLKQ